MRQFRLSMAGLLLFLNLYCPAQMEKVKDAILNHVGKRPTCSCDSLWKKADALEFLKLLRRATSSNASVWPQYSLRDATFILNAGQVGGQVFCLGLIKGGKVVSYGQFENTLTMLTPLYSYYLNYKGMDSLPDDLFFHTAKNAGNGFKKWMDQMGISSAVYMPVVFSTLPFKISPLVKVQIGIHEAFHVEVMLKYWYLKKGSWPRWDNQPDRKAIQSCYTYHDQDRTIIQKELAMLADLVESLLEGKNEKVCSLGREYLNARENRYDGLSEVKINKNRDTLIDCRAAEALLELEEGMADYASWTVLFNLRMASKAQLMGRYRARQDDHFYLSGNMMMHAMLLMDKKSEGNLVNEIVNSADVTKGSLLNIFKMKLNEYCAR